MLQSRKFYYILFVIGALYVLLVQQFFQNEGRFILQSPSYSTETQYSFSTDFQELNLRVNEEVDRGLGCDICVGYCRTRVRSDRIHAVDASENPMNRATTNKQWRLSTIKNKIEHCDARHQKHR